jgi:small subunit ribosomal protein S8
MTMTDPIADMLTRIRNAARASHDSADIPGSRVKINIAKVLKAEGYIKNFRIVSDGRHRMVRVFLNYDEHGQPVIGGLKRVSKPSCRVYCRHDEIPSVLGGFGISIVSTSKGLVTDRQARELGLGGEVVCSAW